ncbi:MAG: hypothetical protein IJ926_02900, partial [Firmicutes bacterium]|nr:hypothetical protein [Bacillota bacterium]
KIEEKKSTKLQLEGLTTYWGPVTVAGEKYYLLLVDNDDNYSQDDIFKLAEIIELAMGMWNFAPERDPVAEFIRALRRGNRGLAYSLMQELNLEQEEFWGVFYTPGIKKDGGLKELAAFENEFNIRTLKMATEGEIAGLILNPPRPRNTANRNGKPSRSGCPCWMRIRPSTYWAPTASKACATPSSSSTRRKPSFS